MSLIRLCCLVSNLDTMNQEGVHFISLTNLSIGCHLIHKHLHIDLVSNNEIIPTCWQSKGGKFCEKVAWKGALFLPQHDTNIPSDG